MKHYYFLFLLTIPGYAQVLFLDKESKAPIAAVNLYSEDGELIGFTNNKGEMTTTLKSRQALKLPLTVNTQHLSYEGRSIVLSNLSDRQVIELKPTSTELAAATTSSAPKDVVVLTGYYRSLETFDSNTKYFSDGIVKFYFPTDGGKVKYELVDYRIFRDSIVEQDFGEKMAGYFKAARLPNMTSSKLIDRIKQYKLHKVDPNNSILEKDNKETGRIETSKNDQRTTFFMDMVLPDTLQSQKIFRLEARAKSIVYLENYSSTVLNDLSPYNLTSSYQHTIGSIKRKAEFGHIPYEELVEFYVMERSDISFKAYKELSSDLESNVYKTEKKSHYTYNFWEDLERFAIPAINEGLKSKLNNKLRLIK